MTQSLNFAITILPQLSLVRVTLDLSPALLPSLAAQNFTLIGEQFY